MEKPWDSRARRRSADVADAAFRVGVALFVTWGFIRTLVLVPDGLDDGDRWMFTLAGVPIVLIVWFGALVTLRSWRRG